MVTLREFIKQLDGQRELPSDDAAELVTTIFFGLEIAAVMLPSKVLFEDRVSRMNQLWDLIADRDVLVVALSPTREPKR